MGKTFGSGDSTTQKKASGSTDSTKLPLAGGTLTGDLAITGDTPSLTIGDAGEEDTKIVFDGAAQDYYIGLDDSADALLLGLGSTVGTTPILVLTTTGLEAGIGLHYLPATIVDTGTGGTAVTASQSAVTVVLTNDGGYVTLPSEPSIGFQVVVCNASAGTNSNAIRRSGSDQFYDSDTTGGETANQAISAMKAKTCIYYATNKWLVIG